MSEAIDYNVLKATDVLPSPKGVMLNVMRLCQREQVSLQDLAKQIQADPVLAGRIIKMANYIVASGTRPIASVTTEVLILVGVHAVRQVALGISLVGTYKNGACRAFDYSRFWSRSVAMACAAQALTGCIRIAPASEMFTCGLLAGIGQLGLASARPQAYSDLLERHAGQPLAELTAAETLLFEYNHLSLAAAMMNDWNIPRLFSDAVLFHEDPQASGFEAGSRKMQLTQMLQLASCIADLCIAPEEYWESMIAPLFELGLALGIDSDRLAALVAQTSIEWQEWGVVLQVQTHDLPPLELV